MNSEEIQEVLEGVVVLLRKQTSRTAKRIASLLSLAIILLDELDGE